MINKELKNKIIESCEVNHIWLNVFNCINPDDAFKIRLTDTILSMLSNKDNLLPSYHGTDEQEVDDLQKLSKVLYLSINKS